MMRELAELGMRMSRAATLGAEARAQAGTASALALQRSAKMVRLTVALDKRLVGAPPGPAIDLERQQREAAEIEARRGESAEDSAWVIRNLWKLVGKPLVRNTVELAIETEAEGAERERLLCDLHERLVDREDALTQRGPGQYDDIIAGILKELGLSGSRVRPASAGASAGGLQAANDPAAPPPAARAHPPP